MKRAKQFDCVQMKNDIQARLLRKYAGLTDEERLAAMERQLAASDSPVAQLWRDLTTRQAGVKVAETPAKYPTKQKKRAAKR